VGWFEQTADAVLIGDPCAVHPGLDHQAFGVHQQMPLPAANLLASVEAPLLAAHAGGLSRLCINDASAGLGVSTQLLSQAAPQGPVHLRPGAVEPPRPEVVEHRFPGRKLPREHASLAAAL